MKKVIKFLTLMIGLMAALFLANFTANAIGSPALFLPILSVLLVLGLIPRTEPGHLYDTLSPDLSAIATYAGKFSKKLHRRLMNGLDIAKDITPMFNVKHAVTMANLVIKNGPKPYTGVFKPKGKDIGYNDRTLTVEKFQRDIEVEPSRYRTSYLGEDRSAGEGANNMTIPYSQYTMETIIDENAAVLNDQTAFHGIGKAGFTAFNPATAYTGVGTEFISFTVNDEVNYFKVIAATTAGETPITHPAKFEDVNALAIAVGLGTKIKAGRTSGDISNVSTTGAITSADAYEQFQEVWRKWPEVYRKRGGIIYCSQNSHDALLDDIETKVSKHTILDLGITYLPKTNKKCEVRPVSWMSGSDMLICTTKENLIYGTDLASDINIIRVIPTMYTLQLGITGVIGFQYQDGGIISMNDMN